MKNSVFLIIFLLAGFTLFGQNPRDLKIHIMPVTGEVREGDNAYFHKQLTYEVILRYQSAVRFSNSSEFIFKGVIEPESKDLPNNGSSSGERMSAGGYTPVPDTPVPHVRNFFGRREFFSMESGNEVRFYDTKGDNIFAYEPSDQNSERYIFTLEMLNRSTGDVIGSQSIVYSELDSSLNSLISVVVDNMLYDVPEGSKAVDWQENWVFLEISFFWSPRYFKGIDELYYFRNFGVKMAMEVQFSNFMSLGFGAIILQEEAKFDSAEEINDLLLEIPVLVKFDIKISDSFVLEPYGGVSWNSSLGNKTIPSLFSWFAGFQFNLKAGAGAVVIDPRFSMDFYEFQIPDKNNKYNRYGLQLGIGYKIGIGSKTKRIPEY